MVGMDAGRCEGAVLTRRGVAGRVREDPIPSVRFSSASTCRSARSVFSAPRTDEDRREDSSSGAYRAGAPGTASSRSRRRSPFAEEFLHARGGGSRADAVAPAGGSRVVLVLVRDDDRKTISHGGIAGGGRWRRGCDWMIRRHCILLPASSTLVPSI